MTEPVRINILKEDVEELKQLLREAELPRVQFKGTGKTDVESMRQMAEELRMVNIKASLKILYGYLVP